MTVREQIEADETLLSWARYSIRYNTRREDQARDFLAKLKLNGREVKGATLASVKGALYAIEGNDD